MPYKIKECVIIFIIILIFEFPVYAAESGLSKNAPILPKSQLQLAVLKQEWGRDPFLFAEKKDTLITLKSSVQLMGILTRGDKKIAIVNKTFVRTGETILGYVITAIENDRIVLNKDGEETVLRIAEHEKKS